MPKTLALLLLLFAAQLTHAQTDKKKALELARTAIKLMDDGKIDESIQLLEEAQKLDPDDINYPYELAYAYYSKENYSTAAKYLEGLLTHKDVTDQVYQLLGNSYDILGQNAKAIETYEAGLKLFPNSGYLYLEMGVIQVNKKDYNKAIGYFEKGIQVKPGYASNYYWAAKIFCASTERVWGMIYGEIFMNLERNSRRTAEISNLLYETYKEGIHTDTAISIDFSRDNTIRIHDNSDLKNIKLPFPVGGYGAALIVAVMFNKQIDINSLNDIRSRFVDIYFQKEFNKMYPNVLFDYQKKLKDAGHLEAYNYWILMKGEEDGFEKWQAANQDKWDKFVKWFSENPLKLDEKNKFYREQYDN